MKACAYDHKRTKQPTILINETVIMTIKGPNSSKIYSIILLMPQDLGLATRESTLVSPEHPVLRPLTTDNWGPIGCSSYTAIAT